MLFHHFEFRKKQYIETFNTLAQYNYINPYVIEALCKNGPTFLDDYSHNIFYAQTNKPHIKNHGANEARTLLEGLKHFNFNPEDMIIKLTGRYQLISDYFLRLIENNPEYDAFVKIAASGGSYTLGFAMRYKYLKEMYETINYAAMEKNSNWVTVEMEVSNYINRKIKEGNFRFFQVEKLDIQANLFGSSTAPGAREEIRIY